MVRRTVLIILSGQNDSRCTRTELFVGPFFVTRPDPTHQMFDPTQLDPTSIKFFGPDPTQATFNAREENLLALEFYNIPV